MALDPWQQWQAFAAQFTSGPPWQAPRNAAGPDSLIDAAARFNAEARKFFEETAHASATAAVDAGRKFSDFLREHYGDLQPLWTAALGAGAPNGAAARMNSPALGATREHQQRALRMADAWRRAEEAQRRLQRLWSDALREAATAFAARLGAPQPTAVSAEELRKLYDTWIDCAEDAYAGAAHSDAFGSALADCLNASCEWRRELQANIEHWAKMLDLPTRSEVNTLTQRLIALEKQLRAAPKPSAKSARASRKTAKSARASRRTAKR
jgi:class III poly(R)-hydroxyalkanoic acid synthase PhaE subunit